VNPYKNINLTDPRQDIHRERVLRPALNRFRVAGELLPTPQKGASVLEIGGGAAEFSQRMRAVGYGVTFVDLSEGNVARAVELGFPAQRLDLNLGLPCFGDESFDGAVMLEIIEHVVAAEQLLLEVKRVLKPGGFLILSTPNFGYFLNRLRILCGGLSEDEGYHYRFFTPRVLRQRLRVAGLTIEHAAHTTPALGYNFLLRHYGRRQRRHWHVPNFLAPMLAHTLIIRLARGKMQGNKIENTVLHVLWSGAIGGKERAVFHWCVPR